MVVTRDMGPLLIAGYGAGAFVAASVAMWWHQRSGAPARRRSLLAVVLFAAWIVRVTLALFRLGSSTTSPRRGSRTSRRRSPRPTISSRW